MQIGIGLPANIPGAGPEQILEWARRAEDRGYSCLSAIDRIVFDNYEPLVALAAAAAVTRRIRLATSVIIAPCRLNAALLAKQAASVNKLSGGRLVLGMAPGGRDDDYVASNASYAERGKEFDRMLAEMTAVWAGEGGIGPSCPAPEIIIGGFAPRSFRRVARFGDGWIAGADGADSFAGGAEQARRAWKAAGRDGAPFLQALAYFSVGEDADRHARDYLRSYYSFSEWVADRVADATLKDAETLRRTVKEYAEVGTDELILLPVDPDPSQVDLLADIIM
ncbi:LLM class flavin-dependent oxidoreductase [Actinomadura nitritigenes]|uniref:LLM class flavin-dependent oxidoreductase n=1 Tax=Actinomadura nitritigenes TaxID=134602 RepID=UPI003D8CC0AF